MPSILKEKGYVSLQTGKWWEGNFSRGGFTQGMTHGDMKRSGRHGDVGLKIGREGMKVIDDFVGESAKDAKPFFLWYAPIMPHTPHDPPERLLVKYREKTTSLRLQSTGRCANGSMRRSVNCERSWRSTRSPRTPSSSTCVTTVGSTMRRKASTLLGASGRRMKVECEHPSSSIGPTRLLPRWMIST